MMPIPLWRRLFIAALTLGLAAALFRPNVAAALVTRGDDAVRNGDRTAAVRYYRRALSIDGQSIRAADRLAFTLGVRQAPGDAQAAIAIATAALTHAPNDPALLADRGFAEQRLREWTPAESDFARAGQVGQDARYDHLAGRIALRRGDVTAARRLFALALSHDRAFVPARVALAGLR